MIKLKKNLTLIFIILSFNLAFAQEKPEKASHIFNKAVELAQKKIKISLSCFMLLGVDGAKKWMLQ